jgi:hypothetical protein
MTRKSKRVVLVGKQINGQKALTVEKYFGEQIVEVLRSGGTSAHPPRATQ